MEEQLKLVDGTRNLNLLQTMAVERVVRAVNLRNDVFHFFLDCNVSEQQNKDGLLAVTVIPHQPNDSEAARFLKNNFISATELVYEAMIQRKFGSDVPFLIVLAQQAGFSPRQILENNQGDWDAAIENMRQILIKQASQAVMVSV